MPRYFFHVYDGKESPEDEGVELPNADEACREAVVATGEAIRDSSRTFWNTGEWQMLVTDEGGATVCHLKVSASR